MAADSAISWTKSTFNPWMGCTKVGPGCDHCYAEVSTPARAMRILWGAGMERRRTSASNWREPLRWNAAAKATGERWLVFCASLADVFDNEVDPAWRADLWALIRATPHLTWQLVTKRVGNVKRMLPPDWGAGYPNVWILATICNVEEACRDMPKLLDVPAVVHGVSWEPALEAITWDPWMIRGLGWLIIGGESTQTTGAARPFRQEWARLAIDSGVRHGVPVFMKQMGSNCQTWAGNRILHRHAAGANPMEWPAEYRVQQFPSLPSA